MLEDDFRLTNNPFFVLKASYEATANAISDLVEDAEFDGEYASEELQRAQQALVTPRSRLVAELAWLPELSASQISKVFDLLEHPDDKTVLASVDHFPELAKANIAAHMCAIGEVSIEVIHFLVSALDEVNASQLITFINEKRAASEFPGVDETQLSGSLNEVRLKHAKAAAASIWRSPSPGQKMNSIVEEEIRRGSPGPFLGLLVREYDSRSEPDLARIGTDINHHVAEAKKVNESLSSHITAISNLLVAWDDVNQPVQLYEQHRGHEEGRSKRIYAIIRELCIDLANDYGKYDEALRLSEALLRTFPELESVAEALKKDISDLEALAEHQDQFSQVEPLIQLCQKAKDRISELRQSLVKEGFCANARGALADIFDAFNRARSAITDPSAAYLAVRELALFINNDRSDPEAAFYLVQALLKNAREDGLYEVVATLTDDRSVLHKNWKMKELELHTGNLSAISNILDEMLEFATGSDRRELQELKSTVDRRKFTRNIKYAIYAIIAGAVGYSILADEFDRPSSRSTYRPPAIQSTPSRSAEKLPVNAYQEDVPPIGSGRVLGRSQVRYCVFQSKRLEYIRPLITTNQQVDRFNRLIADYNLRCSSYQYRKGVLSSIQAEAASRASVLRVDAKRIVSAW